MRSKISSALYLLLFIGILSNVCNGKTKSPKVKTSDGNLKGLFLKSRGGKSYSAFLGIPYAKTPKRFQLAEPAEKWKETREVIYYGDICIQKDIFGLKPISGSEDCLFINVFSPKLKGKLPVMVYIHGGAFKISSSNDYQADYFMDESVILVTFNYRLGPLGFLGTEDGAVEANLGLKDQLLALQWVKKHINAFGGDSEKITIFGESAGAASVHYHVMSPMSQGLFHQAILQSGSALNRWAFKDNAASSKSAFALGNALGCNTENSKELLQCLSKAEAHDIINTDLSEWYLDPVIHFAPTVDHPGSGQIFLPETPINIIQSGNFNNVPTIFTACEDEGLLFHSAVLSRTEKLRKDFNDNWLKIFPITFGYQELGFTSHQMNWISTQIKEFYFGDKEMGGEATFQNLTNLYSDRAFFHGIEKAISYHVKHNKVYAAILAHKGKFSLVSLLLGITENLGVAHGDEVFYLFNRRDLRRAAPYDEDEIVSKTFVSLWANFATNGDPGLERNGKTWEPLKTDKMTEKGITWLKLNSQPEELQNPFKERMRFWDNLFEDAKKLTEKEEL